MRSEERRAAILNTLRQASAPVSASALAGLIRRIACRQCGLQVS